MRNERHNTRMASTPTLTMIQNEDLHDRSLHSVDDLLGAGLIAEEKSDALRTLTERYQLLVTSEMHSVIRDGEAHDPVALQFIPDTRESVLLPQELSDPIGDYTHAPTKALVHRHADRVLLKPTTACAVYCRFCFRREMVGPNGDGVTQKDVDEALEYIASHEEIREVILTGGDPLVLSIKRMRELMQKLHAIPHVRIIRLHTRVPVVAPSRVTPDYIAALAGPKKLVMAIHANHAREFTQEATMVLERLARAGVMLLGQSVLLKGVNADITALTDLVNTMLDNHIKPYYLHHPDLTSGTSHFRMPFEEGMALMDALRQRVSGIAIPQYTLDIPGGVIKIPINRDTVRAIDGKKGHYRLNAPDGKTYDYKDVI